MGSPEVSLCVQNAVVEHHLFRVQTKVLRIAGAKKLKRHLHQFFAGKFGSREGFKHTLSMLCKQSLSLPDALFVRALEL